MSYGVQIIRMHQLCDQWDESFGGAAIFLSLFCFWYSQKLSSLSTFKKCSPLCLYYFLTLSASCFFFCSGRPFQCEIMVYAPWQSDTMHSPGPAPSGFNLIWPEKKGCVRAVVKRWRSGYWVEKGGKMKASSVILCWIVSPSFILPKLPSPLLTRSINSFLKW